MRRLQLLRNTMLVVAMVFAIANSKAADGVPGKIWLSKQPSDVGLDTNKLRYKQAW